VTDKDNWPDMADLALGSDRIVRLQAELGCKTVSRLSLFCDGFLKRETIAMKLWILMMLGASLALGQTKPVDTLQKCRTMLDDAAHDHNPDVREGAAEALSLVGIKDNALLSLAPMLDDHDVKVRIAVVITLGDFKDSRTIPLLKKALEDPVPEVDFAAAKVLYQLHDPAGVEFLLEVVSKESKGSSSYLTKEKRSALRLLTTPTQLFTTIAIMGAGFAPVPGLGYGLSSARGILSATDSSARAAALLLIGASRDPELADAVESALTDKEWSVRAAAAHLIALHPFPQFREALIPLLDDDKDAVRVRAAAAYIRLQHNAKMSPAKHVTVTP
jgi:HEAT repeat protein